MLGLFILGLGQAHTWQHDFSVETRMLWSLTMLLVSFVSLLTLSIPDSGIRLGEEKEQFGQIGWLQFDQMFCHFGEILKGFGNFWRVYLVFGKILNLLQTFL